MFATETKEVTLYSYSEEGVFTGEFQYLWVVGTGIAASATLEKTLKEKDGFVSVWDADKWVYAEDHIGETVYNTETKESKQVDYVGEVQQGWTLIEPIEFGIWDGVSWIDNRTAEQIAEYERSLMPTLSPIEFDIKLKIAYNRATFFSRTDSFVNQARIALGLTNEQIDAMWAN